MEWKLLWLIFHAWPNESGLTKVKPLVLIALYATHHWTLASTNLLFVCPDYLMGSPPIALSICCFLLAPTTIANIDATTDQGNHHRWMYLVTIWEYNLIRIRSFLKNLILINKIMICIHLCTFPKMQILNLFSYIFYYWILNTKFAECFWILKSIISFS